MSTYADHLEWMNREIDKAFQHLNELLAERAGFLAARTGKEGNPYEAEQRPDKCMILRYQLGFDNGKTKLMVEGICDKSH